MKLSKKKKIMSDIHLYGNTKEGYILSVDDEVSNQDLVVTKEELKTIYYLIKKRLHLDGNRHNDSLNNLKVICRKKILKNKLNK